MKTSDTDQALAASVASPIDLPQRKLRGFEVRHSRQSKFDLVSLREALLTGKKYQRVEFAQPIRVHGLYEGKALWIADTPIEVRQHREAIQAMHPYGRVLVGGLGLGIAATLLAQHPRVEQVDVVEISPEIATLCNPHLSNVNVIVDDFESFIGKQDHWPWTSAFVDLWRGTSEGTWWEEVMPIRRLIAGKFGKWDAERVLYWAEDMMVGQVGQALMGPSQPHWFYKEGLRRPMSKERARWFLLNVGTPLWEKRYGALYPKEVDY